MDYVDLKYLRLASVYLHQFKSAGNDVYNFRCPICGDSKKDTTKARGYVFVKGDLSLYHCHNCGAPDHRTLGKLIQFLSISLYNEYRFEKFGHKFGGTKKEEVLAENENDVYIDKELTKVDNLKLKRFASERLLKVCTPLPLLDKDHSAWKYLLGRALHEDDINKLFYLSDINLLTSKIDKYKDKKFMKHDAILIPFVDFDGVINCIQLRILDEKSKLRYLTLYLNEDRSKAIYGLNYIDPNKTVYACEGPFNSMFLDNGIAFAGSSQSNKIQYIIDRIKDVVLIYDNDYRTNPDIMTALEKSINDGYKVVLYDNTFSSDEDINDIVKKLGWTRADLMKYIKSRTFSGLHAKLELSKLTKPVKAKPTYNNKSESSLQEKLSKTLRR
jgi:transcription elongation factor Elf1